MEEEAPVKRSVAELAGKFKNTAPAPDTAQSQAAKPVRRRPPRTLQLPTHAPGDQQEEAEGAAPVLPGKAKRNSALIEKLQANLALSPTALLPSPKSPGLRFLPPSFNLPCPGSPSAPMVTPITTLTPVGVVTAGSPPTAVTPQSEEEAPTSFETPPSAADGAILPSINKGRARLSIKRRPPSRRHRKSSSDPDVAAETGAEEMPLSSPSSPVGKPAEVFEKEVRREEEADMETETSASPEGRNHSAAVSGPRTELNPGNSAEGENQEREDADGGQPQKEPVENPPSGEDAGDGVCPAGNE